MARFLNHSGMYSIKQFLYLLFKTKKPRSCIFHSILFVDVNTAKSPGKKSKTDRSDYLWRWEGAARGGAGHSSNVSNFYRETLFMNSLQLKSTYHIIKEQRCSSYRGDIQS